MYIAPRPNTLETAIFCFLAICRSHVIRIGRIRIVRSIAALINPITVADCLLKPQAPLCVHSALGGFGAH